MTIKRSDWLIPTLLILLSLVPSVMGGVRLAEIGAGGPVTADNARFHAVPLPIVLHIAASVPFALLGALQFSPALRRRGRAWHRITGRALAPLGLLSALTGLWMAHYYPWPPMDGVAVYLERIVFGVAMVVSIVMALVAVRRRDFTAHGDWMTRGYAIGLGAGTQVFTHLPWVIFVGPMAEGVPRAVMMGAGWVINAAVAEWVIRRRRSRAARPILRRPVMAA